MQYDVKFENEFKIEQNQSYDLEFHYIVNEFGDCKGNINLNFSINDQTITTFKYTNKSLVWQDKSVCFTAPENNYKVIQALLVTKILFINNFYFLLHKAHSWYRF